MSSPQFWLLASSFGICGLTTSGLFQTHLIPHGIEHGFTEMTMAMSLGVMGAADVFGTILSGWLCDRYGKRWPLAFYYVVRGATLIQLPSIDTTGQLMIFSIIYGMNWLSTIPATSALTADLFGKQNVGVVFGWICFAHQIGAAIAAYSAGYVHSLMGVITTWLLWPRAYSLLSQPASLFLSENRKLCRPAILAKFCPA
ncbi:MFS transporter [Methylomonas koyamae]|uniref:MFS transporter n=1 Tax=Methylomonas koyamae TaxID=702114 RepID=UPI000AF6545B|nr:MFS transporter [Methylomonas koyamae]